MRKRCRGCNADIPIEEYYPHPRMADGRLNYCKGCVKGRVRRRYAAVRPARSAYEVDRKAQPGRRATRAEQQRLHRKRHPERYAARTAVGNALRDGRLVRQPCVSCGTARRVQAHHHDYSRPLDVVWLCFTCHREGGHGQVVVAR